MSILTVGCGCKEYPDADVYLDLYPDDSSQRKAHGGKIKIPIGKKFIQGDIQNMNMFKYKEFDYVYAHNILEHLEHPGNACKELMRVAKAGSIKVPSYFGELFFGWDYHLFSSLVYKDKLYLFEKKQNEHIPFGRFFRERCGKSSKYDNIIIPEVAKVFKENKALFDITFEWENNFRFEVIRNK